MGFIFTGVFWSIVLVLLGIGIILNVVLKTRIPFFRIFFALLLIYIGITMLFGVSWRRHRWHSFRVPEKIFVNGPSGHHDLVFGQGEIDLTGLELKDSVTQEEVDVVFAAGRIKLRPDMPVRVEVSSAFAEVRLPDGGHAGFGDNTYESKGLDKTKPYLLVKTDVVFGRLDVVQAKAPAAEGPKGPS